MLAFPFYTNPFAIFGFFSLYSSTNLLKLLLVCFIIWFTYSCFLINLFSHRRCTIFYFLIKFKNQILTQVFSCELCEIFKNICFIEHLRATAFSIFICTTVSISNKSVAARDKRVDGLLMHFKYDFRFHSLKLLWK